GSSSVMGSPERPGPGAPGRSETSWPIRLCDDCLAGGEVGFDPVLAPALSDEVVDQPDDHDEADQGLEHRPRGEAGEDVGRAVRVLTEGQEVVDERVGPRLSQVVAEGAEDRTGPDADVDHHQAAPEKGQDVEDGPPASEAEPGPSVRPSARPCEEDAQIAQEVADVDHPR